MSQLKQLWQYTKLIVLNYKIPVLCWHDTNGVLNSRDPAAKPALNLLLAGKFSDA